ncbi:MAG: PadR family transcriptional regulator [Acidobacteria bacterium]|nr:PadR family transcriptional regulator [Acidobacteriota bacterium]
MKDDAVGLLQGTLDMLILKAVSLDRVHGYGVSVRLEQLTNGRLRIPQGSLYPALARLERKRLVSTVWGASMNGRRAKYYFLTAAGTRRLAAELDDWREYSEVVAAVLRAEPGKL